MTTLNLKALQAYGLNRNEIAVFGALIEMGGSYAKELVEKTKFHKNIVYDNLYKLIDKGLVSQVIIDKKKFFQCENPQIIDEFISQKQKEFRSYKEEIEQLKKIIGEKQKMPSKTMIRMFVGLQGVKQIFRHELEIGKDYLVLGAPRESVELLGEHFWKNFLMKQKEIGMKGRLLLNESLRDFAPNIESELNLVKYLKDSFEPLTEISIYSKFVSIVVWSAEPVATLIENEQVAKSYRAYFEMLWKISKK